MDRLSSEKIAIASGLVGLSASVWFLLRQPWKSRKSAYEPPGPKGVPFFGNEFQIPKDNQYLKFHEWIKTFGMFVRLLGAGMAFTSLQGMLSR